MDDAWEGSIAPELRRGRYRMEVGHARDHALKLANHTLDTGRPTKWGEYEPADEAYAQLLEKLDERQFADTLPALRRDLLGFYGSPSERPVDDQDDDERERRDALARLKAMAPAR